MLIINYAQTSGCYTVNLYIVIEKLGFQS